METKSAKRVLICPLDWGLGHATRCIPIIEEFKNRGCEIFIASSGQALSLLKTEFPVVEFDELPPYNPHYSSLLPMPLSMALQIPRLLNVIKKEHRVLEGIIEKRKIDLVISDNRYGCWSKKVLSVFITHQINIIVPWYAKRMVNEFNKKCIVRFSFCWIPDWQGEQSLAGSLSKSSNQNIRYLGPLSRFKKIESKTIRYNIIAIISGPEPQRSEFEKLLRMQLIEWSISSNDAPNVPDTLTQIRCHDTSKVSDPLWTPNVPYTSKRKCLLVKGIPSDSTIKIGVIDEVDFLNAADLNKMIAESDIVICRSGYSTLMDLAKIGKKAILVPTPGQTEQEYLALSLKQKKIMYSEFQKSYNLKRSLIESKSYTNSFEFSISNNNLNHAIDEVL